MLVSKRDENIDILKALGIILMVYGHIETPQMHFIYLFHMAIFFIASGYLYKGTYSDDFVSVRHFVKRKIKSLYCPYVIWMGIFTLLHNIFIDVNIYTNNEAFLEKVSGPYAKLTEFMSQEQMIKALIKNFLMMGQEQMGNALWFLNALLLLSVLYCFLDYFLKRFLGKYKDKYWLIQGVIAITFLLSGYECYLHAKSLGGVARVLSFYILFYVGALFRTYDVMRHVTRRPYLILLMAFVGLLIINEFCDIELARNQYTNPVFYLIASLLGWVLLYGVAYKIKTNGFALFFCVVGRNTMPIIIFHFLAMKIVTGIGLVLYDDPVFCLAAFTTFYQGYSWWLSYTVVGIAIPVCLKLMYMKAWTGFKNRFRTIIPT